jgi:hypothetical protein
MAYCCESFSVYKMERNCGKMLCLDRQDGEEPGIVLDDSFKYPAITSTVGRQQCKFSLLGTNDKQLLQHTIA